MRRDLLHFYLAVATKQKIPCGVAKFVGEGQVGILLAVICVQVQCRSECKVTEVG